MPSPLLLSLLLSLTVHVLAFQFPIGFSVPFFKSKQAVFSEPETPRIAIIGAGAGGSSAAFWIAKAKERFGVEVEIDVYEREEYIGGRSTVVYPYNDTSFPPVELGASIFVENNKNLMRAAKEFNLSLTPFEDDDSETGIWDGQSFVFIIKDGGLFQSWWNSLKFVWRYGFSAPTQTQAFVKSVVAQFVNLYTTESPRWDDVAALAAKFEWTEIANQSTAEYLDSKGIAKKFTREIVEAATRVNYGQNADEIHALEGACSMAATSASGVERGNYNIFEQFLERSGAAVHLGTTVQEIKYHAASSLWNLTSNSPTVPSKLYKGIILAAPYHFSNIVLPSEISDSIPPQPYIHLHVTLLSTRASRASADYFGVSDVPRMVLTTLDGVREGRVDKINSPEFNSLTFHGAINRTIVNEAGDQEVAEERVVKIFSSERVSDEWLERLFGHVGWVYRKEWDAYPRLNPTDVFPPVKLDQGIYYVNAFEPFISTMETQTIAARNVVDLLLHEEFGSGICGSLLAGSDVEKTSANDTESGDFVLGWDC